MKISGIRCEAWSRHFRTESQSWFLFGCLAFLCALTATAAPLSTEQQQWLTKASRFERNGWIYIHIEGEARWRGFQHGYMLAREIAEGLRSIRASWKHETAMEWPWLVGRAGALFVGRIDPENLEELDGLVEGMQAAGQAASR